MDPHKDAHHSRSDQNVIDIDLINDFAALFKATDTARKMQPVKPFKSKGESLSWNGFPWLACLWGDFDLIYND